MRNALGFDRFRLLSSILVACLAAAGCDLDGGEGERADGEECPAGETCSSLTPKGLRFTGPDDGHPFDFEQPLPRVAVGGQMTVKLESADYGKLPAFDIGDVTPAIFSAVAHSPNELRLVGLAPGSAELRILAAGTPELLDRRRAFVDEVARVELSVCDPTSAATHSLDQLGVLAGTGDVVVTANLRAQDDGYLVDENLLFDPPSVPATNENWHSRHFAVPETGNFLVRASAGGQTASVELVAVPTLEAYEATWQLFTFGVPEELPLPNAEISLSHWAYVCAWGTTAGRRLCNVAAEIEILQGDKSLGVVNGCWLIAEPLTAGPATVRVGAEYLDEKGGYHVEGVDYAITITK